MAKLRTPSRLAKAKGVRFDDPQDGAVEGQGFGAAGTAMYGSSSLGPGVTVASHHISLSQPDSPLATGCAAGDVEGNECASPGCSREEGPVDKAAHPPYTFLGLPPISLTSGGSDLVQRPNVCMPSGLTLGGGHVRPGRQVSHESAALSQNPDRTSPISPTALGVRGGGEGASYTAGLRPSPNSPMLKSALKTARSSDAVSLAMAMVSSSAITETSSPAGQASSSIPMTSNPLWVQPSR